MHDFIQKKVEEFRKTFKGICPVCGNFGVNTYGECKCSYEPQSLKMSQSLTDYFAIALTEAYTKGMAAEAIGCADHCKEAEKRAKEDVIKELWAKAEYTSGSIAIVSYATSHGIDITS